MINGIFKLIRFVLKLCLHNKSFLMVENHSIDYFLSQNNEKIKTNDYHFNFLFCSHQDILIVLIKLKLLCLLTKNKNYYTNNGICFTHFQLINIIGKLNDSYTYFYFLIFNKHIFLNIFNGVLSEKQYETVIYNINSYDRTLYKLKFTK